MSLFLIHPRGELQSLWSVQTYRACYRSKPTGPVIGLFLQGQLSVHFSGPVIDPRLQGQLLVHVYRANDGSISSGPVIGLFLQGQWFIHFFRASDRPISSDRSISSGSVIGLFLQSQLSVHPCQPKHWAVHFKTLLILECIRLIINGKYFCSCQAHRFINSILGFFIPTKKEAVRFGKHRLKFRRLT